MMSSLFLGAMVLQSASAQASCGGQVRFIHGEAFRDGAVNVYLNRRLVESDLQFREVSPYHEVKARTYTVSFQNAKTGEWMDSKTFTVGPNVGYTIVFAGPAEGPAGMAFGNSSPFILVDDISPVSNPDRWKGTWYRMSETQVNIDFRVALGDGSNKEVVRLKNKPNRASYQLGDFPSGTYKFNPVLIDSSDALFNTALTPARNVEVGSLKIMGGETVDIIALGNFLGKTPNSLDLTYAKYRSSLNEFGCYSIQQ